MASFQSSSTALQRFFRNSTYCKYSLVPEKSLRLVYEPWNDAIRCLFKDFLRIHQFLGEFLNWLFANFAGRKRPEHRLVSKVLLLSRKRNTDQYPIKKPEVFLQRSKIKNDVLTAILNQEDIITLDAVWRSAPVVTKDGFSAGAKE